MQFSCVTDIDIDEQVNVLKGTFFASAAFITFKGNGHALDTRIPKCFASFPKLPT